MELTEFGLWTLFNEGSQALRATSIAVVVEKITRCGVQLSVVLNEGTVPVANIAASHRLTEGETLTLSSLDNLFVAVPEGDDCVRIGLKDNSPRLHSVPTDLLLKEIHRRMNSDA